MATLERTYTIPLRREYLKVSRHRRAKKAVIGVFEFISRHMKQPDRKKILIGQHLNLEIWKHGIKNPPIRLKVNATKNDEGIVNVELFGAPKPEVKTEGKKGKAKKGDEKIVREPIVVNPQTVEVKAEPVETPVETAEKPKKPRAKKTKEE